MTLTAEAPTATDWLERLTEIAPATREDLRAEVARSGRSLLTAVLDRGLAGEEAVARAIATETGVALLPVGVRAGEVPEWLNPAFLEALDAALIAVDGNTLEIATADPTRPELTAGLRMAWGGAVALKVATRADVRRLAQAAQTPLDAEARRNARAANADGSPQDAPAVRRVNDLVGLAARAGASDIHIQPDRDGARVRLRVDGVLRDAASLGPDLAPQVAARIKVLAGLDISERRLPQDGRFSLRVEGETYDVRTAVVPSADGESLTLRLLRDAPRAVSLDEVGLTPAQIAILEHALAQPQGLILATGPTGSGKTTTLAAAVGRINDPSRKIVSIEDPVEYRIDGVTQIPIKPAVGLTFASALRSVLRADPDVIVVGELRDPETAQIACNAALTGHLVLATLHATSVAGAPLRLLDLGVEPGVARAVLRLVIDQRLLRRTCPDCAPTGQCLGGGCVGEGYRGRVGAFELLEVDDTLGAMIAERAPVSAITAAARAKGVPSLRQDAEAKVAAGLTRTEELVRVLGPA